MIHFEFGTNENWKWLPGLGVVEFTVEADGNSILCRVSKECIADHCGDPAAIGDFLGAAKRHFDEITDKVAHFITIGRFESDGSILLKSADW